MHAIRIIGSTELGWHPAHIYTPEVLATFAGFRDVFMFDVTIGGAHLAPSTIYGYAKAASCPFTLRDAHRVLEMIRPMLMEAKHGQANRR
jgi:hypothetical protein